MTKKIVGFAIVVFSITSPLNAMLVKALKNSAPKAFQQQRFYVPKITSQEKMRELQFNRQYLFEQVIEVDDVEVAGMLMGKFGLNVYDDLIEIAQSPEMLRFLEEYGCDIRKIDDSHGGNYLHKIISDEGREDTEFTKDFFIKYALDKGVNPHAVDNFGENLWHKLLTRPFTVSHEETHLLDRARLLRSLYVNPHHKDEHGRSAIELVQGRMHDLEETKKRCESYTYTYEDAVSQLKTYHKLLKIMNSEDCNQRESAL